MDFPLLLEAAVSRLVMSFWIGIIFFMVGGIPVALLALPNPYAVAFLAVMAALLLVPLDDKIPGFGRQLCRYSVRAYTQYHRFTAIFEDVEAFQQGQSYVIGYTPHSCLPTGIPLVFSQHTEAKPPGLGPIHSLTTSVVFYVPIVRHLFHWLGGRPASRESMNALLDAGGSVLVIPGGVAECGKMQPGREVVFLKNRTGFVRIALQHGASLVPVFCFGQTEAYSWVRLGPPFCPQALADKIARKIGFMPLYMYGVWGSPLPFPVRMTMAIGEPMPLPKIRTPTPEVVQQHLEAYISALRSLFEKHRSAAGYGHWNLHVI